MESRSPDTTREIHPPPTTLGEDRVEGDDAMIDMNHAGTWRLKLPRPFVLRCCAGLAVAGLMHAAISAPRAAEHSRTWYAELSLDPNWRASGPGAAADAIEVAQSEPPSRGVPPIPLGTLTAPTPLDFPNPTTPETPVTPPADNGSAESSADQSTVFDHPHENGAIVDHCVTWATDCGQPGADQFCRSKGHERAVQFDTFPAKRTYVLGSRQICEGPHCVGFSKVVCAAAGDEPARN
jgi:hypothetical protein